MISVAYTDVVNGVVMIIGLFVAFPFLLKNAGGWSGVINALPPEKLSPLGNMSVFDAAAYALPTMLLLLGESGMYQRFFSAKDPATAKRSVLGWISGTIIIETLVVVLAIIGCVQFSGIDSEMVILHSVRYGLTPVIGCLLLAAIVAVIVSTADSFLLVPATNIMRDIWQRFFNPDLPQRKVVFYSRVIVIIMGVIAFVQLQFFSRVLEMALYAYTMYGVGITPAVMAAFFWKRATPMAGALSIAAGMLMTLIWEFSGQPWDIATIYPALISSVGILITVSLLAPKPSEEKWRPFF